MEGQDEGNGRVEASPAKKKQKVHTDSTPRIVEVNNTEDVTEITPLDSKA